MAELIDFLENVFEADVDQIKHKAESSPGEIIARKGYVFDALSELWAATSIEDLPELEGGELRPIFAGSIESVSARAASRQLVPGYQDTDTAGRRRRMELQTLLLYAHSIAVQNPLAGRLRISREGLSDESSVRLSSVRCSDQEFLVDIYAMCDTAKLARSGILHYFDPPRLLQDRTYDLNPLIERLSRNLWLDYSINVFDQGTWYRSASAIFEQVIYQITTASLGIERNSTSLLIPTDLDERAFLEVTLALCASFGINLPLGVSGDRDSSMLHQLCNLSLPGVTDIQLRDVVAIREDDSFAGFRIDMRTAAEDAQNDLDEGRIASAQQVVSEHMKAALERLNIRTRRGILSDAIAPRLVGWGFGATAAGAVVGWQAAAATLLGSGLTELFRKSPSRSERARRNHYVALSDKRAGATCSSRNILRDSTLFFQRHDETLEESRSQDRDETVNHILRILEEE